MQQIAHPLFRQSAKSSDNSISIYAFKPGEHLQGVKSSVKLFHADSGGKMNNPVGIAF